ncbi:MAG: AraC family transcriptional regulator [Pseudomonadales bacterium]|nr:AraC family transcriptional regulator [Pseudomonadales bacterium]
MDILNDVLKTLRLSSKVFLDAKFCDEWVIDISPMNWQVNFHVIANGDCWLHSPDTAIPVALHAGDLIFCLRNKQHLITHSSAYPADDLPRNMPTTEDKLGKSTSLICGYCEFLQYYWNPLLEALPDVMVLPAIDSGKTHLSMIVNMMVTETSSDNSGSTAIIDRLSDILFIEAIRTYMQLHENNMGYIALLKDPQLSKALASFHKQPEHYWSVQALSEEAGMSRSRFAEQFKKMLNMSPMEYVTGWRMQHAYDMLVSDNKSVMVVAENCGYQSEPAFRKAFKKQFNVGPGWVRREAKEQASSVH